MKNYFLAGIMSFVLFGLFLAFHDSKGASNLIEAPVEKLEDPSVARLWNEALLYGIRNDFARPTVHARNLFHVSMAMYDMWAVYSGKNVANVFLGRRFQGFYCAFDGIEVPEDPEGREAAQHEAISYAVYRLLQHRFVNSPRSAAIMRNNQLLMESLGYDPGFNSADYSSGSPAALGNYLASKIIEFGLQDGSNEANSYVNTFYQPLNEPLDPNQPGNPLITNPNRWQPLLLDNFIDQSGNPTGESPPFLSPEWGRVKPFALSQRNMSVKEREGLEFPVYFDPGAPPNIGNDNGLSDDYKWNHSMVAVWSGLMDPSNEIMMDISPASVGNNPAYPENASDLRTFYDYNNGGDNGSGYEVNPVTGQPYVPQIVPLGDYARVLAEFWADGPDSETPPGHWFTILNYVNDHPELTRRFGGTGDELSPLEWDVRSYLMMGGAMHDVAITAWGIKGYYDYIRPVSAIRYMADRGQSEDPALPNYNEHGLPLIDGAIELVQPGDPLAGLSNEYVNKIKVYAWKGPRYITDPSTDQAGAGWILAENWWPYQRPTFVTPPFAGYISGHSTFSSAGAEILELLTGSEYFPGGLGEFIAHRNEFLVFEEGPSVDIRLQWARYRDAADHSSISRIWGGIHPPADDMPGRHIGHQIAQQVFDKAVTYFTNTITSIPETNKNTGVSVYPNPVGTGEEITLLTDQLPESVRFTDVTGKTVLAMGRSDYPDGKIHMDTMIPGLYLIRLDYGNEIRSMRLIVREK